MQNLKFTIDSLTYDNGNLIYHFPCPKCGIDFIALLELENGYLCMYCQTKFVWEKINNSVSYLNIS